MGWTGLVAGRLPVAGGAAGAAIVAGQLAAQAAFFPVIEEGLWEYVSVGRARVEGGASEAADLVAPEPLAFEPLANSPVDSCLVESGNCQQLLAFALLVVGVGQTKRQ